MAGENGKGKGRGRGRKGGGRSRGRGGAQPTQGKRHKPHAATLAPKKGKAFSTPYEVPESGAIGPFDLFCAFYLGILPDGSYRHAGAPNLGETARRLGRQPGDLKTMLATYGMEPETVDASEFDISLARLDIQVAPEGIDRRELARGLYDEFIDLLPDVADAEARFAAGDIVLAAEPARDGERVEGAEGAPARGRRRGRGRARRSEDDNGAGGPVAVDVPESAAPAAPSTPAADALPVGSADEPVGVAVGAEDAAERPVRRVRRSPARRGG